MTILDANAQPVSSLAEMIDAEPPQIDDAEARGITPKRRDLRPMPGQVIVLRGSVDPYLRNKHGDIVYGKNKLPMEKPIRQLEREEAGNIEAIVARTGHDLGERPTEKAWWKTGDHVVIQPHVFTEVFIAPGASLWIGPFAGIKGVFEVEDGANTNA